MSQAKVDKYKEYKKNRKTILAKEKKQALMTKIAAYAVIFVLMAAIVAGIGVKIYKNYQAELASRPNYTATSLEIGDMVGILDETEESAE